ncbi:MAG TPA: translation initiation factor IF-2 [Polyangia bacterium]|nr:translation initiation factor IF-2 [Polyangia bacterium]
MNSGGTGHTTTTADGQAGKVRLYEVAKDLGLSPKDLVDKVRALGIPAKNHMSNLDAEDVVRVKRALDKERQASLVEERLSSTVIRRRSKDGGAVVRAASPAAATPSARPASPPEREPEERSVVARAKEALSEVVHKVQEVAHEVVEKVVPSTQEKPVEPTVVETRREEAPRRVVVETRREEPRVEVRETVRPTAPPVVTPPAREEAPRVEARATPQAPATAAPTAAPGTTVEPKKEEPVKFGPTGRVIELPLPRIEIRQADPRDRFAQQRPGGGGMPGQRRDTRGPQDRFGRGQQGKKKPQLGKKQKQTQITTPAAHKRIIKMDETIAVGEIAKQMGVKAPDVLKKLWGMGMTGIMLNNAIDHDTAVLLASEFGFEIESVAFQEADVFGAAGDDKPEDLVGRAPVVTIMGHVDHGKTSLLDAIRDANVAAGEAGGITQHIGAYKITAPDGNDVVFLDTPGHEAFTAMRARGAQATDLVILVVAADDGVMQTTVEALNHAKDAEVPILVAVNKIDKQNAQPERIRQQLSEHGLIPEAWGGETIFVDVSARNKTGIDQLLQMIGLQSELLELKANPNKAGRGTVIEAKLDRNRGPMATVLVQDGTLKIGDTVVAGEHIGKVRAMLDDKGRNLTEAGPSTPVEVLGLSGVPEAGEALNSVADEKQAKELVDHRRDSRRKKELAGNTKVSLENILERIKEGAVKELKVVLKADVQGSAEALKSSLTALATEQVKVDVISAGVGGITESDVNLARAGNAIIVGFHVRPAGKAQQLAEQEGVDIKLYDIIYEALDDVKKAMAGLLAPVKREKALGKAEVRQTFTIPKIGTIAGSFVIDGTIKRNSQMRLVRDSVQIYVGKLTSLRRFKDDVREVVQGYECGIGLENYNDIKVGDIIEAYEIEEIAPTLE